MEKHQLRKFDIVVVGGGVAGLFTANELAKHGVKVLVLEKKNDLLKFSFHTLGSFLDVERYGFTEDVVASRVTSGVFHSRFIHAAKTGDACVLDKVKLHEELLEMCGENGVEISAGVGVADVEEKDDGDVAAVVSSDGRRYAGRIFIDASGRTGYLTRRFGLLPKKDEVWATGIEYNVKYKRPQNEAHLFYHSLFKSGYGWIFPLENGRAIFGYGTFEKPGELKMKSRFELIRKDPVVASLVEFDNDKLQGGVFPVTDVVTKFTYRNVLGIGDSVSQGSPLVGEGYRFIIDASLLAVPAVINALKSGDNEKLLEYDNLWNKKFGDMFRRHKKLQKLALRGCDNDFLGDILTLLLKTKRASTFQKLLAGDTSRRNLLLP